jgi:hypothetical protein
MAFSAVSFLFASGHAAQQMDARDAAACRDLRQKLTGHAAGEFCGIDRGLQLDRLYPGCNAPGPQNARRSQIVREVSLKLLTTFRVHGSGR